MEDTILTITERLKDLRKKRGLTLKELSEAVDVSKSALGTYETGDFKDISPFDEYIGSVLRDDLTGILNDIRESHPKNRKDKSTMSVFTAMEDFQKNVHP